MNKKQLINNILDKKDELSDNNYDRIIQDIYNMLYNCDGEDFYNSKLDDLKYRFESIDGIEDYIMNMIKEDWITNTLHFYKDCNFDYDNNFKIDEYGYVENVNKSDVEDWIDDILYELQN